MKIKITSLLFTVLWSQMAIGQSYFNKIHSGTHSYWNLLVQNDGYIFIGDTLASGGQKIYLTKTNQKGETMWHKVYGENPQAYYSNDILPYKDGFIVSASVEDEFGSGKRNIIIIAFNNIGEYLWDYRIYHIKDNLSRDFIKTTTGFALGGVTTALGSNTRGDFYLAKFNEAGNFLWEKIYGEIGVYEECYSVSQTADGGFVLSGVKGDRMDNDTWDIWVIKTDANGNEKWQKTYGSDFTDYRPYIQLASDGNVLTAWNSDTASSGQTTQMMLAKLDVNNGNIIFQKEYTQFNDAYFFSKHIVNHNTSIVLAGGYNDARPLQNLYKI